MRNYVKWLAMFLSVVAGTFASQLASKYTDGRTESAISSPSGLDGAGYEATVALSRGVATYGESARN
jgi:hypothetical protein